MKNKIKEFINDYSIDLKKYLKYIRKKIKNFFSVSKRYYRNLLNNLNEKEKRKKYLITMLVSLFAIVLTINILSSFGFYNNKESIGLIHSLVGDLYGNNYDYVLRIYLESANEANQYHLVSDIPSIGYSFSGFKCQNNSILSYDPNLKNISSTINSRDICSAYFDLISDTDISINIMLEESIDSNTYILGNNIPSFGYTYSHYECDNNNKIEYNSNLHKIILKTNKKDNCNVYFKKSGADIIVRLFIENTAGNKDYIEKVSIPENIIYTLNQEKSNCKNTDNERVDSEITYNNGYIETNVKEIATCEFYLDKNE